MYPALMVGVTPYNDRWCHPSRLGWVQGAVSSLAGAGAPVGTGAETCSRECPPSNSLETRARLSD